MKQQFDLLAKELMERICSQIEEQDSEFEVEINFSNEVLTLEIGNKIYVINKQSPLSEIWLASPISGPYHFKLEDGRWVDSKNFDLFIILSDELSGLLNKKIVIS